MANATASVLSMSIVIRPKRFKRLPAATPALWAVRTRGVHFENSYALFPTFTTANASAMATGADPLGVMAPVAADRRGPGQVVPPAFAGRPRPESPRALRAAGLVL